MKRNGAGRGNGSADGTGGAVSGVINLAHLKAEIERLRTLKAEGIEEVEYEFELGQTAKLFGIGKRKFRQFVEGPPTGNANRSGGQALPASIEEANRFVDGIKSELIIETANLPAAAVAVRDAFAATGHLFERGVPVKVVGSDGGALPQIVPLTVDNVVMDIHELRRPIKLTPGGHRTATTLPDRVAKQYLAKKGEWNLPRLAGLCTAPLLCATGSIRTAEGYDRETRMWCWNVPTLSLPERPSEDEARQAFHTLRAAFRTFPFADAARRRDADLDLELVELEQQPGRDESAFLTGLMTGVCRPSLTLAPALMLIAGRFSGSGSGKGLLIRAIALIAFGLLPSAFSAKDDRQELEKTLGAAFLEGGPSLLLDNVNDTVLRSPTLESALTERPSRVRLFGKLKTAELDATQFVAVTGNALRPSRDLVRRFIFAWLDAGVENPALRRFPLADEAFLEDIERRRPELLSAALTIWRWGRQNATRLTPGLPLGSYSTWSQWCRDPLLALGCADPVERIGELAAADPEREEVGELFEAWWRRHGEAPTYRINLHPEVLQIVDPEKRGRQRVTTYLDSLAGARHAGYLFERQKDMTRSWIAATYRLKRTTSKIDG
jgi:putative DNA primase/helicase